MKLSPSLVFPISALFLILGYPPKVLSQSSSNLTNSAAPSASSVTTGGTNINYQTNNTYQNEYGYGPGIFCRTPTMFIGGNLGSNEFDAFDSVSQSGNSTDNYSANIGLVLPLGLTHARVCSELSKSILQDREISTQLSLIKACASLQKDGIVVDPDVYPLLSKCTVSVLGPRPSSANLPQVNQVPPVKRAKTTKL